MQIDGPLLIELRINPLGLLLTIPDGRRYGVPLSRAAAQSLYLALTPHVVGEMEPELEANILEAQAEHAAKDQQFLREMKVTYDQLN